MSKRMTSETIIFDTDWLTEADFGEIGQALVNINCQAYDTLKTIVFLDDVVLGKGGLFQEFDVYKLENFRTNFQLLLAESNENFVIYLTKDEDYFELTFILTKDYWETYMEGIGSIYIKGVKR